MSNYLPKKFIFILTDCTSDVILNYMLVWNHTICSIKKLVIKSFQTIISRAFSLASTRLGSVKCLSLVRRWLKKIYTTIPKKDVSHDCFGFDPLVRVVADSLPAHFAR